MEPGALVVADGRGEHVLAAGVLQRLYLPQPPAARRPRAAHTPTDGILLTRRHHGNRVSNVSGVHLTRRAHPHAHNPVPDKFQIYTSLHAAGPVTARFTRAIQIVWAEPFVSNVCEKEAGAAYTDGELCARVRTVGWRDISDPSRGTHISTELLERK